MKNKLVEDINKLKFIIKAELTTTAPMYSTSMVVKASTIYQIPLNFVIWFLVLGI